jgi:hypothetical protein
LVPFGSAILVLHSLLLAVLLTLLAVLLTLLAVLTAVFGNVAAQVRVSAPVSTGLSFAVANA